ncbi:MAG: type IV secretion system protein [Geobacteraceae bacterium]
MNIGPTDLLNSFLSVCKTGQTNLLKPALGLLAILSIITITWHALMWSFDESGNALKEFLRKVIFIGAFIFIVQSFPWLVKCVISGFTWVGNTAGNPSGASIVNDPTEIMKQGVRVCANLVVEITNSNSISALGHLIVSFGEFLAIILCFVIIAVQVFLVNVELGIITTLGLILIPFGVWRPTSFIAEKVFGAIISFGVKLMVLSFILAVAYPFLKLLALPPEPSLLDFVNTFAGAAMLAFLSFHAPGMAAGLISGSPSLSAQNVSSGASRVYTSIRQIAAAKAGGPVSAGVAATRAAARGGKT